MVRVSIEVRNGAARFRVAVRAESLQRAVSLMRGRYPGDDLWVKLPINPEGFFVNDSALIEMVGFEQPHRVAA